MILPQDDGQIVPLYTPAYPVPRNPLTYLDMILTDNYDAAHRAGAFFIGLGFAYSALFSCVFENVLPAGNDISSLAPKYISIKRGFAICQIITVV
jgi:NCS1 family nucleobase:cation symporter-1